MSEHKSARPARVVTVTVSDTRTEVDDRGGAVLRETLAAQGHRIVRHAIVRDDIEAIRAEARRAKDIQPQDLSAFVVHDRAFHQAVAKATHNPPLQEIVQRLHDQILRFFFLENVNLEKAQTIHDEHTAIAEAIAARC